MDGVYTVACNLVKGLFEKTHLNSSDGWGSFGDFTFGGRVSATWVLIFLWFSDYDQVTWIV